MDIDTVRNLVRNGTFKGGGTAAYSDTQVDLAAQQAGNDFLSHVALASTTGTVALDATSVTVSFSGLTLFRPENLVRLELENYQPLPVASYQTVQRALAGSSGGTSGTATPTMLGFSTPEDAVLNVTPGTDHSVLNVLYRLPFTTWTAGGTGTTVSTAVINIPDRYAHPVFHDGAASILMQSNPEARQHMEAWQRYLAHRDWCMSHIGDDIGPDVADPTAYME